jgi:RNA polymerase sigma-70 factor (ECF subfamily)
MMTWSDEAFTAVFEEIYPGLCRYLEGLLGRGGAAQETAQEALLRLYRLGPGRVAPGEERFWVYRVATNAALNELRRASVRARLAVAVAALGRRRQPDPHERAELAERDRRLGDALGRLPAGRRAALLLREHEELSYAEIASVLGVSVAKVKTDVFRARAALRGELAGSDGAKKISRGGADARRRGG